jgi:hypothetical protein
LISTIPQGIGQVTSTFKCSEVVHQYQFSTTCDQQNNSFSWNNNDYLISNSAQTVFESSNLLTPDSLLFFVTDTFGCVFQLPVEVNITPDTLAPVVEIPNPLLDCDAKYSGTLQISGGSSPYNILWSDPSIGNIATYNLSGGSYSVTIIDANNCKTIKNFDLASVEVLSATFPSNLKSNCQGTYVGDLLVQGGSTPYSYYWTDGISNTSHFEFQSTAGVILIDANGCTESISIALPDVDTLSMAFPDNLVGNCAGFYEGNLIINGGNSPYSFDWTNAINTSEHFKFRTNETVILTDANGCSITKSINLPQIDTLSVTFPNNLTGNCRGTYEGNLIVNGGNAPFTFDWADVTNTTEHFEFFTDATVVLTDANGCTKTTSINLPQIDTLSVAFPNNLIGNCDGLYVGDLLVNGGNAPIIFDWSDGADPIPHFEFRTHAEVQLTDANGCTASASIILPTIDTIQFTLQMLPATGANVANGQAITTTLLPINAYKYQWSNGATTTEINGLLPGTYCVTVTNTTTNCTKVACIEVDYVVKNNEIVENKDFSIFPNPASDFLQIRLKDEIQIENLNYEIFDFTGKKCAFGQLKSNIIDIKDLPQGIYSVRINSKVLIFEKSNGF